MGLAGLLWDAFELDTYALFASLDLLLRSLLDTVDEVEAALGVAHVLNAYSEALLNVAVPDGLLDNDPD